jgi:hypothetical protein
MKGPTETAASRHSDQLTSIPEFCNRDSSSENFKGHERRISCPDNIDDFLALYRHEDWSIQQFLDCLEDPRPSQNEPASCAAFLSADICHLFHDMSPEMMPAPEAATLSVVSKTYLDSLRADTRRRQNRNSQQRRRDKLKSSALQQPAPHSQKPKLKVHPAIRNTESSTSCQRLHRAMIRILGSRREAEARIFQPRTVELTSSSESDAWKSLECSDSSRRTPSPRSFLATILAPPSFSTQRAETSPPRRVAAAQPV